MGMFYHLKVSFIIGLFSGTHTPTSQPLYWSQTGRVPPIRPAIASAPALASPQSVAFVVGMSSRTCSWGDREGAKVGE